MKRESGTERRNDREVLRRRDEEREGDIKLRIKKERRFRFVLFLWYINHCRLFNAKSSLFIYIRYI